MQTNETAFTLEEVKHKVDQWRTTRANISERMPDELRVLIANLVPSYDIHNISNTLNIKPNTISLFRRKYVASNTSTNPVDFIPIKLASLFTDPNADKPYTQHTSSASTNARTECIIIKENGSKLILHNHDPITIVKTFLCSN